MPIDFRSLVADDAAAATELAQRVWRAYDRARGNAPRPPADEEEITRYVRVFARHCATDPEGAHAAWSGEQLVGVALARRREALWGLSLLLVAPEVQGKGIGGRLLGRAWQTATGARSALIVSSADPRAIAVYRSAGFELHPALRAAGRVRTAVLRADDGAREGDASDLAWIDEDGARLRGARFGSDLPGMLEHADLVVVVRGTRRGWAFLRGREILQVGATDGGVGAQVLAAALARVDPGQAAALPQLPAGRDWAADVALELGLRLEPAGPLCVRGAAPASSYLPNGIMF